MSEHPSLIKRPVLENGRRLARGIRPGALYRSIQEVVTAAAPVSDFRLTMIHYASILELSCILTLVSGASRHILQFGYGEH